MSKDIFTEPARFSPNLKGAAYLGAYQQNHLVRISHTTYVDFIDIPTKYPRAKCVNLVRVRPKTRHDKQSLDPFAKHVYLLGWSTT